MNTESNKANCKKMKKKYIAPAIEIIKVEGDLHLLSSSGNGNYNIGDISTPTTPTNPSGDGTSGGIGAGGDDSQWSGQGAKKNNSWGNWDY